ncbi:hypothetical protein BJX76DRAFT_42875 [Aspergillus varians]
MYEIAPPNKRRVPKPILLLQLHALYGLEYEQDPRHSTPCCVPSCGVSVYLNYGEALACPEPRNCDAHGFDKQLKTASTKLSAQLTHFPRQRRSLTSIDRIKFRQARAKRDHLQFAHIAGTHYSLSVRSGWFSEFLPLVILDLDVPESPG